MAFKKINKENIERKFLDSARGDNADNDEHSKKNPLNITKKSFNQNLKRKYSISFYMDEDEYLEIKAKAEENKMNINQYIRFKVFNINQN